MNKVSFKGFSLKESMERPKNIMLVLGEKETFYKKQAENEGRKNVCVFSEFYPESNRLEIYLADAQEGKLLIDLWKKCNAFEEELSIIFKRTLREVKQHLISTIRS